MMAKKEDDDDRLKKRSLVVRGQATSVRLEDVLWNELRAMADERNVSLSELVNGIDIKPKRNLSAAIRAFVSNYHRRRR